MRRVESVEEPEQAPYEFRDHYNREWLIERWNPQIPRQARERFLAVQKAA